MFTLIQYLISDHVPNMSMYVHPNSIPERNSLPEHVDIAEAKESEQGDDVSTLHSQLAKP